MTTPILYFTDCCGRGENNCEDKFVNASVATDTFVSLTALVLGILGLTAVIAMPAAASYALIGISAGITTLWLALFLHVGCKKCSQQQ